MASVWNPVTGFRAADGVTIEKLAPTATPKATDTLGVPGYSTSGGTINNEERSPELRGVAKFRTYFRAITDNPTAATSVRYNLDLTAGPSWSVEPSDETPEAQEAADFVESVMHDMATPWAQIVKRHAMTDVMGYVISELVAKDRDDGLWGIGSIEARPQTTVEAWRTDAHGNVTGIAQRSPQDNTIRDLPRVKLLYTVDDSLTDSPEGLGKARHVVESIRRRNEYEKAEGKGYETDLRGMPVFRGPFGKLEQGAAEGVPGAAAMLAGAQRAAEAFINGGHNFSSTRGMTMDSDTYRTPDGNSTGVRVWDIETVRGDAVAATAVDVAIGRYDREIARVFNTEGMLLTGGSLALARDKTMALALAINSKLAKLAAEFQRDIFEHFLWPLNAALRPAVFTKWNLPKLVPGPVRVDDVEQLAALLANLASAGAPLGSDAGSLDAVNAILEIAQLPRRDAIGGGADAAGSMGPSWQRTPAALDVPAVPAAETAAGEVVP